MIQLPVWKAGMLHTILRLISAIMTVLAMYSTVGLHERGCMVNLLTAVEMQTKQ